ncbi:hypothetical protein J6590_012952 [Homalodisca vitripennis]|nr:hypothetical protein J6590_012952 [Homalodisca vitripennis]
MFLERCTFDSTVGVPAMLMLVQRRYEYYHTWNHIYSNFLEVCDGHEKNTQPQTYLPHITLHSVEISRASTEASLETLYHDAILLARRRRHLQYHVSALYYLNISPAAEAVRHTHRHRRVPENIKRRLLPQRTGKRFHRKCINRGGGEVTRQWNSTGARCLVSAAILIASHSLLTADKMAAVIGPMYLPHLFVPHLSSGIFSSFVRFRITTAVVQHHCS